LAANVCYADGCFPSLSVDLGSSSNPRNPFKAHKTVGLDIAPVSINDVLKCDLFRESFPFPDQSVSCVTAFDFIEHIPRVVVGAESTFFPFVLVMNEIYRVLSPGGYFLSYTPAFPFKEAFQDPTHVNIITEDTFPFYFSSGLTGERPGYGWLYGFDNYFHVVDQAWHGFRLVSLLRKPL
jgi:SAM-dependent methyltransferase